MENPVPLGHAVRYFAPPLCELQQSRSQVRQQCLRQSSGGKTLMKSPKIHRVLVYTDKEGIPGWWTYGFFSPTPQSPWDVPPEPKKRGQKTLLCFISLNSVVGCRAVIEKKTLHREGFFGKSSHVRVLLMDGGAVKKNLATVRERTNPTLQPHFPT